MPAWLKSVWAAVRYGADSLLTLVCWTLWLALTLLLALQVFVAATGEFEVPRFVMRAIEERFAASHINAKFGRALLDPSGGVLLEELQLFLPEFAEPVIKVRAVYVELEPWPLLTGRVAAERVHATGVRLMVPAMLASSGEPEAAVSDLEFDVISRGAQLYVQYLTTRLAGASIAAHGGVRLPVPQPTTAVSPVPLLEDLASNYAGNMRQLMRFTEKIRQAEDLQVQAALTPATHRGAIAAVTLVARGVKAPDWGPVDAKEVRAALRLPLSGQMPTAVPFVLSAEAVAAADVRLEGLEARGVGVLAPARFFYTPQQLELTVRRGAARGFEVERLAAELNLERFPAIDGRAWFEYGGAPLFAEGRADASAQTATGHVTGHVSPELLTPLSSLLGRPLRRFVDFGEPVWADLDVRFGPAWKFAQLQGRVAARKIAAYHVKLDAAAGQIFFDGRRFYAHHASASLGENFARGSFDQDLHTTAFRFLLEGRLRPLDISGWFGRWWPEFFGYFSFPDAPPDASVDVAGRWRAGHETTVFVYAQSGRPQIWDAHLDYARTLMFIRPNFYDALEIFGTHGAGELRGQFRLERELGKPLVDTGKLSFSFQSSIDVATGAGLLGPVLSARASPYVFERPPHVTASGQLSGPADEHGIWRRNLQIVSRSTGSFSAYGLTGRDLNFDARLHNDEIAIDRMDATIAGGEVAGRARIWGLGAERRLGFDAYIKHANLADAINVASQFVAIRKHSEQAGSDRFLPGKSDAQVDLAMSAEGKIADPYSFEGGGNASISGQELGQIRLLGMLSELLNFTALRFTGARAQFKLERNTVVFPSVNVTGANSAIHAHGDYRLQQRALSFNARVYPFEESKGLLQSVVGAVLTPFSAALEVKLTGTLDQPKWAFVIGPTNLLNSLSRPSAPEDTPTAQEPLKPVPPAPMKTN